MKNNAISLFTAAGVIYSWQSIINYSRFELAVFYKGKKEKHWLAISPQTIYVAGDESKLKQILTDWNRSKNFRYERKAK